MTPIRRARLKPETARYYPSLRPDGWYAVLDRDPEATAPERRPGFLSIDVDGRPRQVWAAHFEIKEEAAGSE